MLVSTDPSISDALTISDVASEVTPRLAIGVKKDTNNMAVESSKCRRIALVTCRNHASLRPGRPAGVEPAYRTLATN